MRLFKLCKYAAQSVHPALDARFFVFVYIVWRSSEFAGFCDLVNKASGPSLNMCSRIIKILGQKRNVFYDLRKIPQRKNLSHATAHANFFLEISYKFHLEHALFISVTFIPSNNVTDLCH